MINIDKRNEIFHLSGETYSYVFDLYRGKPRLLHFGAKIDDVELTALRRYRYLSFSPMAVEAVYQSYCEQPLEFSEFGHGDFGTPAVQIEGDGFISTDYRYTGYEILPAHPTAGELPLFRGGETLAIGMHDEVSDSSVTLYYTVYPQAIVRRAEITAGCKPFVVRKLSSVTLELNGLYDVTGLFGGHVNERNVYTTSLEHGKFVIDTTRGASSHQANPFIALTAADTTEENGRAYGIALAYSGSFRIEAEADEHRNTRIVAGYNPETFSWPLGRKETLSAPETAIVFSSEGLGGMSRAFADTVRDYLIPEKFVHMPRPIVINNWESTYFDFNTDVLCAMLDRLKGLGIDMFVLDDGWFGHRDDDRSSLGDWFVFDKKLPGGLEKVIAKAKDCGMRFGLWFEPEMISADSELYRAHPDWLIRTPGRAPLTSRHQYILDFSRDEVVDNIFAQMEKTLAAYDISYIKWDMNRHMCDMPDFVTQHKYILGVYKLARKLTERFPDLFMEGCSGGGGRYDLGMMKFFPQIWCSDNTDAQARCRIQYGSSLAYPLSVSSNHVSICPNHQTGRTISFKTRGHVAMLGAYGYELNPKYLSDEDRDFIRVQTAEYRAMQHLVLEGDLYRLSSPFDSDVFCFELVAKDKSEARVTAMRFTLRNAEPPLRIYPRGLDENAVYTYGESRYTGRTLMHAGIDLPEFKGDNDSVVVTLKKA